MPAAWTAENVPDQTGRVAVVTGANAGIGYETARVLARKGAHVVMACRSRERGGAARQRLEAEQPAGSASLMQLDLADLDSVHRFAEAFRGRHDALSLLVNNAGVMAPPASKTAQGFELQFGVNVLGHFALTGLLANRLTGEDARVVTVSSLAHRGGQIDFGNLRSEKGYDAWRAYQQSKLADLVFAIELQRRFDAAGHTASSMAAHPGFTATDLQRHMNRVLAFFARLISQQPPAGALPTLYAATAPAARPGGYYGPGGLFELRGTPATAEVTPEARDRETGQRLWDACEEATGVRFLPEGANAAAA